MSLTSLRRRDAVFAAALASLATLSCASLLGGLDEGTSRAAPSVDDAGVAEASAATAETAVAPSAEPRCGPSVAPFRYRVAYSLQSVVAVAGYAFALTLDTRTPIAAGKMRLDGADLRVAGPNGERLPHWVHHGVNSAVTTLWVKADLAVGTNRFYVLYGSAQASSESRAEAVFLPAIANGELEQGSAPWYTSPAFNGATSDLRIASGRMLVKQKRSVAGPTNSRAAWCQAAIFPAEPTQLVFDINRNGAGYAHFAIWIGGVFGTEVWAQQGMSGTTLGETSGPIAAGAKTLCIGATEEGSSWGTAEALFDNLHLRPYVDPEPIASEPGDEESCEP